MRRTLRCIISLLILLTPPAVNSGDIGAGYGLIGPYQMSHTAGLTKLRSLGARLLKTWSIDTGWLDNVRQVFGNSVKVTVAIPNGDLQRVAQGDQAYLNSLKDQLNNYKDIINLVGIGNEPFLDRQGAWPQVVPAATRIHQLLSDNNLLQHMKMTVPFSGAVLVNTYPVANTRFHPDAIGSILQILDLIRQEGSVFSINLYPYFAYAYDSGVTLDFALGRGGESLLKNMLDGCKVALNVAGYGDVPVIIGETGWPTAGGKDTNSDNAKTYNDQVVRLAGEANAMYIFEAFDESGKGGDEVERHWGIMSSNAELHYAFAFPGGSDCGPVNWIDGQDWTFGCDFPGADLINMQTRGEDCSGRCEQAIGCTHYAWTQFNGGTCYMKSGPIRKDQAVCTSEPGAVCGVLPMKH